MIEVILVLVSASKKTYRSSLHRMLQISLILSSTQFDWSVRGLVCCCQHGTGCSFLYLFPWPMRFSPYKDSLCPTVSPRDGLHSPLLSGRERGGWWKEGRKERGKEWVREGGSGVVRCSSEGHGSLALAKKTVLNTCSCLQRPFNLLITCQSITRQPDQMSAAARTRTGREGGKREGEWGKKEEKEKDRLHVWESRKWRGSKWSSCVCISKICW